MESALEKKKRKFRALYELLFTNYRILNYQISEKLDFRAVSKVLEEAYRYQYIIGPETRKCSHANSLEHVCFFNTEEPDITYMEYREDPRVIYNAQLYGFCNSLVISKEEIEIDGEILLKGPRSDYYIPFTPDHSFERALQNMQKKIENFSPRVSLLFQCLKFLNLCKTGIHPFEEVFQFCYCKQNKSYK